MNISIETTAEDGASIKPLPKRKEEASSPTVPIPRSDENAVSFDEREPLTCCCCRRFLDGNREAIAWSLDSLASSTAFAGTGAFLAPALIKIAKEAAGCETDAPEGETKVPECNNKIHGFKPSSLITFYATVIGLAACVMLPLAGAIVDTTSHRRLIGRFLATLYCFAIFSTIFVGLDNWFEISIAFAVFGFVGWFETMVLYSYLPELCDDEDTLNRYTRTFTVASYTSMVLFVGAVVAVSAAVGYKNDKTSLDDEIGTARISQSGAFVMNAVLLFIAWGFLFRPRPPARTLHEDESVWTYGFIQVYRTARRVHRSYPALKWFFYSICLCDAGAHSIMVISITFLTDTMEFSGAEIGTALIFLLLASIPGGICASLWSRWFNPLSSTIAGITVLIANTSLVAGLLTGPENKNGAYVLSAIYGFGTGWKFTVDRLLYARIIPPGQNAEFSGAYIFFRQCLTWLPPLVFTILNENDVSQRWGIASLNIFLVAGWLGYFVGVGNYNSAVQDARV